MQKALGISPSCTFTNMDESILCVRPIEAHQEKEIKEKGSGVAQKFCIIFDDVVVRFLLSFSFLFPNLTIFLGPREAHEFPRVHWKFYQGHATHNQHIPHTSHTLQARHFNFSVFLCSQHFKRIPRICRLQASYLCFFALSNSECEVLCEEFAPPQMKKDNFFRMIDDTLKEPYSFLTVNMKSPWETRFRKGLAQVINLDSYRGKVDPRNSVPSSQTVCAQPDPSVPLRGNLPTQPAPAQRPPSVK